MHRAAPFPVLDEEQSDWQLELPFFVSEGLTKKVAKAVERGLLGLPSPPSEWYNSLRYNKIGDKRTVAPFGRREWQSVCNFRRSPG